MKNVIKTIGFFILGGCLFFGVSKVISVCFDKKLSIYDNILCFIFYGLFFLHILRKTNKDNVTDGFMICPNSFATHGDGRLEIFRRKVKKLNEDSYVMIDHYEEKIIIRNIINYRVMDNDIYVIAYDLEVEEKATIECFKVNADNAKMEKFNILEVPDDYKSVFTNLIEDKEMYLKTN